MSPRNFYSARGVPSIDPNLISAALSSSNSQQRQSIKTTNIISEHQSRANNYHYYTQPVDPILLAAVAKQVGTSKKNQVKKNNYV